MRTLRSKYYLSKGEKSYDLSCVQGPTVHRQQEDNRRGALHFDTITVIHELD